MFIDKAHEDALPTSLCCNAIRLQMITFNRKLRRIEHALNKML